MLKRLFIFAVIILFASCIPNKDLVYLQGEPLKGTDIRRLNDQPYHLQIDDVLFIDVKAQNDTLVRFFQKSNTNTQRTNVNNQGFEGGIDRLSGYTIDGHGNIRLPFFGSINVLGYTTKEVRLKLEQLILQYFKNSKDIFISVKLAGIKYNILGEVATPGPRVIYQNRVTIFDAIANSGDILLTGNRKEVEVWRNSGEGQKRYTIDLTKATALNSDIYYIQPNDIINVKPLKQKSWGTGTTGLQSLSTIISILSLVTTTILLVRNI